MVKPFAAIHLNLRPYRSFRPTCRKYTAKRSKSGVFVEVVRRKCGEDYRRKTTTLGHQYIARVSLIFPISALNSEFACVETFFSTSHVRAEVRMKRRHSDWAKYREASEVIDLHRPFNDYWTSINHEFTVLS